MARATVNRWRDLDIELEYETFGHQEDPTILLVTGYTGQLLMWDPAFCTMLADRGRHVVRFDNRDVGLSTKLDGVTVDVAAIAAAGRGADPSEVPEAPYRLSDFADDAFGLLDALGIDAAHIVGHSMGGMIVQTMAIERPERVVTMTSIGSTTGEASVGEATREAMQALLAPHATGREAVIDQTVERWRILGSPAGFDPLDARRLATEVYDRSHYPEGEMRQLAAIRSSGDRAEGLSGVSVPTLVIHGAVDSIIQPSGGERTADLVPGAELLLIDDMGHMLDRRWWPQLVEAIISHTSR